MNSFEVTAMSEFTTYGGWAKESHELLPSLPLKGGLTNVHRAYLRREACPPGSTKTSRVTRCRHAFGHESLISLSLSYIYSYVTCHAYHASFLAHA